MPRNNNESLTKSTLQCSNKFISWLGFGNPVSATYVKQNCHASNHMFRVIFAILEYGSFNKRWSVETLNVLKTLKNANSIVGTFRALGTDFG